MIELTLHEAAEVLIAQPAGGTVPLQAQRFPDVSTDTRSLQPGQCFVALKGERFDGHDFISAALRGGAAVIIHSRPFDTSPWQDRVFLRVEDTLAALQMLAHHVRRKWGKTLLAVTGSVGKTTTREFIAALLGQKFPVFRSKANLNNEIGVPLSLLEITEEHQLAVLELGMNRRGEIRTLARICRPDAALVTNVAAVHLEFFSGVDEIAEAKAEILDDLPGHFFFNADDARVSQLARRYAGKKTSYGFQAQADVRILDFSFDSLAEMRFELEVGNTRLAAVVPFVGKHFLYNIAAAVAVASAFGLSGEAIAAGISQLRPAAMRGRVFEAGGATVWDDSYNSNPQALAALLDTVGRLGGFRRKILALGEMLELGSLAPELHREAGRLAALIGPALLITVGKNAVYFAEGAIEGGAGKGQIRHFDDSIQASEFLAGQLERGDFLLVKGSRAVRMDEIIRKIEEGQRV